MVRVCIFAWGVGVTRICTFMFVGMWVRGDVGMWVGCACVFVGGCGCDKYAFVHSILCILHFNSTHPFSPPPPPPHTHTHTRIHTYTHTSRHNIHTHKHTNTNTHMRARMHACTHASMHTHTGTYRERVHPSVCMYVLECLDFGEHRLSIRS